MIIITIILPVYCNIIDALVQVTYSIFLQITLRWMVYKRLSQVITFLKSMKATATIIKLCSNENKLKYKYFVYLCCTFAWCAVTLIGKTVYTVYKTFSQ